MGTTDCLDRFAFTRRALLGGAAAIAVAGTSACQIDTGTPSASSAPSNTAGFPDLDGPPLPTEQVEFRWVDSGDLKSVFEKETLDLFTAKYPQVKTTYDGSGWDTVNQVVPLGVRNKSAHDVFALPQTQTIPGAIAQKWIQPLDDLLDVADLTSAFPDGSFVGGVHVFDGKTYTYPLSSLKRLDRMAFYDTEVMKKAGYDNPVEQITTWDELRAALKKVTSDAGKPGLMLAKDSLAGVVSWLALTAGFGGTNAVGGLYGGFDFKTGTYHYTDPIYLQAVEFLQSLVADKSVIPGFLSMTEKDARAQMSAGVAGMIFNGPWDIPAWKTTASDWAYSIGPVQTPAGAAYTVPFRETGGNGAFVYAESKLTAVATRIIRYMCTLEGQIRLVITSQGLLQSLIPEANERANASGLLDVNAKRTAELANQMMRRQPMPELRNVDAAMVTSSYVGPKPTIDDIMQGVFSGQITNPAASLKTLNDAQDKALDAAIAKATAGGASVSRDDYVFANWDRTKDYTAADYQGS